MLNPDDIQAIRKLASIEAGRRFFDGADQALPEVSVLEAVMLHKAASAKSVELFGYASMMRPEDPFSMYEEMGGLYKDKT